MYRIYYTDPESGQAKAKDVVSIECALGECEYYRNHGFEFVTMVSDYQHMVGKPGASGPGTSYVPQMLN
jgi:hypothetical protein